MTDWRWPPLGEARLPTWTGFGSYGQRRKKSGSGANTVRDGTSRTRYRAFISYSHCDERLAKWLHKAIESYQVPKPLIGRRGSDGLIPKQIFPVFRDREDFRASSDLSASMHEALSQSASLIVLCSPASARSRWVNQEILEFKRLGRGDRIFALIVGGEPSATDIANECFPRALRFDTTADGRPTDRCVEPIAADLRPEGDGRENAS
jgi:hypothetical protein